ncbi:MAG TPA: carbon starvation CstA family protein [Chloroflexota bacterium]|nr:carbon starvation CstA family protein [Chloroflexota bacterium]
MNTLYAVIIAGLTIYLGYTFYARRIDRNIIQSDPRKATPARMYMDGVDFVPASRSVLYGYHFKSIAAAGPIVGAITAAILWGWLPSIIWLVLGVTFIGWMSDYSAIMVAVRNDGNSVSATAHRLISPRTRTILLVFIFFYLVLVAGAFGNLIVGVLFSQPQVPLAIVTLVVMGILGGQMLYRWKTDLILMSLITVGITLLIIIVGPLGMQVNPPATQGAAPQIVQGPVGQLMVGLNTAVNSITGGAPVITYYDPTLPLPPNTPPGVAVANVNITPAFLFWLLGLCVFSYLGAILPIWRFAQPVNYIGFWITFLTMVLAGLGAAMAVLLKPEVAALTIPAIKSADLGFMMEAGKGWQPLWPMLFVTIACGAISGWHALIGSVGTARQIENETDVLPVGGGSMFTEMTLGMLALLAVSIGIQGPAVPTFANGIGSFLSVLGIPQPIGAALGFSAFVVIVITVFQLVIRVMRVTLTEGLGDRMPVFRNPHVNVVISLALMCFLVLSGIWVYLWQLFGSANQLMAALSLLVVTVWLVSTKRNPTFALIPTVFMYLTTMAATLVIARNLWETVLVPNVGRAGAAIAVGGAGLMVFIAGLLFVAAAMIGWDGIKAYQRYSGAEPEPLPAEAPTA